MSRPLNVLQFICPTGFYGAERWILALARHLDPDEVRCDLAVTREPGNEEPELLAHYAGLGLNTFQVEMKNRFDPAAITRLARLIEEREIDLIHTHGYKSDIIGLLAARRAGIPCLVTPHGFENARDLKLRLFIWLGCRAMRHADRVAPLSRQLEEDCRRIGVRQDKLAYIQNGVDLSEVHAATPAERDGSERRIGFVGQMISRKNVRALLDVFEAYHRRHPGSRLVLLGDGEERAGLEAYATTLAAADRIDFLGFRKDRLALLKTFDLFAMTSTLEGIPRCLMEAMAAGIPAVAYDIPGIDQLIIHGETGLLAPPGDSERLLAHWETLLHDEATARALADRAKAYVEEKYSAQRMAREYTDLFRAMAGGRDGNARGGLR
ncbi:MAG TPA: glycosyltransferase [Gammaproteobacteria bacterium]|nr:glycosyltransferase [Gammaproteobacteria bacterium]